MIEVNLYSIAAGDYNATVGKCLARNRFDKESMGVTVEEFVKGFLKENLTKFENVSTSLETISELVNSASVLTRRDITCINYYLEKQGYTIQIQNVADDEDNATGVPSGEVIEWNVIDTNFMQNGYPTTTKIIPGADTDIPTILKQIVERSGLFNEDKFAGMKNPFTELFTNIERIKNLTGGISASLITRVYETLDRTGIKVFCATSED